MRNSLLVLVLVLVAGAGLLPFSGETHAERTEIAEPSSPPSSPAVQRALEPLDARR